MKKRLVLTVKLMLVVAAFVIPFTSASATDGCPPQPGGGPTEGWPSAGAGSFCVGVYYCVDLQAPYTCKGKYPAIAWPFYE
jgi:hypothetical protein